MFPFRNGRPRRPRPSVEDVPQLPQPPAIGLAREEVRVLIDGVEHVLEVVRVQYGRGKRAYWVCRCGRRTWHLYLREAVLACSRCHRLTYESRRRHSPGAAAALRVVKLRRKLGAVPRPFAPLPKRPKGWRPDYWRRSIARLIAVEAVLAARLHAMVRK